MKPPAPPLNEVETIPDYLFSKTPEERFDRITRLTTCLFDVPVAMIIIIDEDRWWIKSCQGLHIHEVPQIISLSELRISKDETFIIFDAKHDPRTANNPVVIGPPFIRFYAGCVLRTASESVIGMFCIKDFKPRSFSDEELASLKDLASMIENELRLVPVESAQKELMEANQKLKQKERTSDVTEQEQAKLLLAQKAVELETVAEVSTAVSTVLNITELLQKVANLMKDRLNLYHVQIYILSASQSILHLAAGAGETGRQMLAKGVSVPIEDEHSAVAKAARTKQVITISDVRTSPAFRKNPFLSLSRSEQALPLIVGHQILGVLDVQDEAVNHFAPDNVLVLNVVATQIAVALKNARLFEQTQVALAETETLYDLAGMLNTAKTLDEALQVAVSPAFGAHRAVLYWACTLSYGEPESVELISSWGTRGYYHNSWGSRLKVTELPLGRLIITNPEDPLLISDVYDDNRIDLSKISFFERNGTRATAVLPLVLGSRWIGFIRIDWPSTQEFSEKDKRLYQSVATQSAIVVNNLLLLRETQVSLAETETLYDISRGINEATSIEEVLITVAQASTVRLWNRVVLLKMEYDQDGRVEALTVVATWSYSSETPSFPAGKRYAVDQFSFFNIVINPDPIFFDDMLNDELLDASVVATAQEYDIRAMAALPLRTSGRPQQGVVLLQSNRPYEFSQQDIQRYNALTPQISAAFENQRLLEETRVVLAEVEAVQRRYTLEAWERYHDERFIHGYEKVGERFKTFEFDFPSEVDVEEAVENSESSLIVPLNVRGQMIGLLGLETSNEERVWTPEEKALVETVAEQLAQAAENIRLLDNSQRLSKEQEKTIEQLKEVDRLKSEFLTSMSHELRTPLNSIIGFADVLLQGIDGELSDPALNDIKLIHNSGQHLLALINDILDLSKIEAGRMELVREALDIREVFDNVLAASSSLVKNKPVEIFANAPKILPDVHADKLRLNQILLNLVSNAVKFTAEGSVTIKAELPDDLPDQMRISVVDTGIGIPADKLDAVFDRFHQADGTTTRKYGGTGLGLAISANLTEMHGGKLQVKSEVGVGSEFYFAIPLASNITPDELKEFEEVSA